ncbi:MAG TPA: hypothetical protein VGK50_02010 [Coriobacteriia bacterium]|jgi:hypothetical protein
MSYSRGTLRGAGYGALVAVLVTATLSAGAVLYQLFEGSGHAHAGAPAASSLAVAVDAAGFVMMLLLGMQLMTGYRLVGVRAGDFRRLHVATAWTVAGLLGLHGLAAVVHTLEAPEMLPVALDLIGLGLLGLVAAQLVSGYRRSGAGRARARAVHSAVAVAVAAVVAGHASLGIVHVLTG